MDELLAELTSPRELSGLLNHALDGLDRVREHRRFTMPPEAVHAGERFREQTDSVAGFLAERCELELVAGETRKDLWDAYKTWCLDNNRRPLSAQRFHGRVRDLVDLDEVTVKGTRT